MIESDTPTWIENTSNSIKTYFKGVRSEWGKISWPEKRQVVAETFFVIAIVFVFTVAVYLIDIIFKGIFGLIKQKRWLMAKKEKSMAEELNEDKALEAQEETEKG